MLNKNFSPEELEFNSGDYLITIIPEFTYPSI